MTRRSSHQMESAGTKTSWEGLRVSARAYMLTVLAVLSFIGGLFISQPLIFVSVPVVLLLGFTLLRSKDPRLDVEVTRTTERVQIRERESTRVRLSVKNPGPRTIPLLQVSDRVPPELRGPETRGRFSIALRAGETRDLYYEVLANAFGVHTLGPIILAAQDSTGLLESQAELKSYCKIAVFPESAERLAHFSIRPRRTKSWPGEIVARRTGTGMDYYNIRRFVPGDSVKRINWRASARHLQGADEYLVNEYMAELGAEVLIVVDAGSAPGPGRDPVATYTAKAALSIAERLLHDRNRVGLLTTGANPSRIAPAYGKRHFDRIALSLLQLQPAESDVQWWVERSLHLFFPNVSQIIFVSALTNANSITTAAEITRNEGHDVIIVSPNPLGLADHSKRETRSREWRIARRLAEMERTIDLDQLRSANALVIDWTTSTSLEEVLEVHRRALARHAAFSARPR
jgi:uncharacterized protein (DUF58 family)